MNKATANIIISEGKRPFWQICFAAFFFAATVVLVIMSVLSMFSSNIVPALNFIYSLDFAISTFALGLRSSVVINICFDLKHSKYKKEFAVGPIKVGKWRYLPNIDYISVFKQSLRRDGEGEPVIYIYNVNVWYDTSKHFTIYSNEEPEPAFEMARYMALKLHIDVLDATEPNDFKWIDMEATVQEYIP